MCLLSVAIHSLVPASCLILPSIGSSVNPGAIMSEAIIIRTDFGSTNALSFSCNVGWLLISWKPGSRFQVSHHNTGNSRQLSLDWRLEHVSNNGTSSNLDYRGEYQSIPPRGPYDRWRLYKQIRTPLSISILALSSNI